MIWKNKEVKTIRDLCDAVGALQSKEEGKEFMKLYLAENPHAYANVGYVSGYFDRETMFRIQEFTESTHPIFGRAIPTPEQAFETGKKLGAELLQKGEN